MSNENLIYNPYFGTNLCNLLANSIVEKIKSINPQDYVDVSVSNVNDFFIVFGKTSSNEKIDLTELFTSVMDTIPQKLRVLVKVFDMLTYGVERENMSILYSELFTKYQSNYSENFGYYKKIMELNNNGLFVNLRNFGTERYINVISNENNIPLPEGFKELLLSKRTHTSDPLFGKDIRSEKYLYFLSRYIAHTLFSANLCNTVNIRVSTNAKFSEINWENIHLTIDSSSLIVTQKWVESLILDIFDFNPEQVISDLSLDDYNFSNEILQGNTNYPWLRRDKLKDIILL